MNYWLFKCNPAKYDIDARLNDPEEKTTWRVTRYRKDVRAGDFAFIWRSGPNRRIVAVLKIETDPHEMAEPESERKYAINLPSGILYRVEGRFTHRFLDLSQEMLRKVPELIGLCLFQGFQQATNFRVTPQEGQRILNLIEEKGT